MHLRWAVISGQPGRDPMRLFRAMTGECELEIGHLGPDVECSPHRHIHLPPIHTHSTADSLDFLLVNL